MTKNIMIVGVGGQGTLLASRILGNAVISEGYDVKVSEVHGMSQRGGDVQSHLRISDKPIASDLIPEGECDIILSVEPMEALRYLPFLSKDGWVITNENPFINIPNYPEKEAIIAEINKLPHSIVFDADTIAKEVHNPKGTNMVVLGAASKYLGIDIEKLEDAVRSNFGRKGEAIVNANIDALRAGRAVADKM